MNPVLTKQVLPESNITTVRVAREHAAMLLEMAKGQGVGSGVLFAQIVEPAYREFVKAQSHSEAA